MTSVHGRLSADSKPPQFTPRGRVSGTIELLCPFCGTVQQHRVSRIQWRIRCTHAGCARLIVFGLVFYIPDTWQRPGGHLKPPPDLTFPVVPLGTWRNGEPVHKLEIVRAETTKNATEPDAS